MSNQPSGLNSREVQRRNFQRTTLLTIGAVAGGMAIILLITVLIANPNLRVVANCLGTLLLAPLVLLMFIPFLILVAALFGMSRLTTSTYTITSKGRDISSSVLKLTQRGAVTISRPLIWWNKNTARLEALVSGKRSDDSELSESE